MRRRYWSALFLAAAALYILARDAYWVGFFNDDAFYLIGARSLLQGRFAELNHPMAPPLIQYLPGWPLLLAPLAAVFGESFLPAQLLAAACMLAAAAAAAWAFAEDLGEEGGFLLAAVCALNPLALSLSGAVLADAPFTLAALLLVGAARRRWDSAAPGTWLACGAAAGAAALLRPSGLALVLALPAALAWERRRRGAAAALLGAALVYAPWLLRNAAARGTPLLYFSELADPWRTDLGGAASAAAGSAWFYLREMYARTLLRWPSPFGAALAAGLCGGLGLLCAARGLRRTGLGGGRRFAVLATLLLAGTLLVWGKRSTRYLLPLVPFAAAWLLGGLEGRRARLAAVAAALLSYLPPGAAILSASLRRDRPPARAPEKTFAWIRQSTPPDAVFAAELDGQVYLRTGRSAVTLPRGLPAPPLGDWARASRVDYILIASTGEILRTPRRAGPHDPVDAERRRLDAQADPGLAKVFEEPSEGASVYSVAR
ncbi:MAG: glycosyltransferase family 39 protein [Elusimicrobia bacterium]|nr:glycosyltransferase family 39 protein [Elusimicrobiota bacterium]